MNKQKLNLLRAHERVLMGNFKIKSENDKISKNENDNYY